MQSEHVATVFHVTGGKAKWAGSPKEITPPGLEWHEVKSSGETWPRTFEPVRREA